MRDELFVLFTGIYLLIILCMSFWALTNTDPEVKSFDDLWINNVLDNSLFSSFRGLSTANAALEQPINSSNYSRSDAEGIEDKNMFFTIYFKQDGQWVLADCGLTIRAAADLCLALEAGGHEIRVELS
jgi:hypothetical protein